MLAAAERIKELLSLRLQAMHTAVAKDLKNQYDFSAILTQGDFKKLTKWIHFLKWIFLKTIKGNIFVANFVLTFFNPFYRSVS